MAIRVQRHANVSKKATLLDGLDVSPLKWRVCGCGLNGFVHKSMNHISNVKVHLKIRSSGAGNVCFFRRSCTSGYKHETFRLCSLNLSCKYFLDSHRKFFHFQDG